MATSRRGRLWGGRHLPPVAIADAGRCSAAAAGGRGGGLRNLDCARRSEVLSHVTQRERRQPADGPAALRCIGLSRGERGEARETCCAVGGVPGGGAPLRGACVPVCVSARRYRLRRIDGWTVDHDHDLALWSVCSPALALLTPPVEGLWARLCCVHIHSTRPRVCTGCELAYHLM